MTKVALYLRVSTDDQTTENQDRELRAVAERHGWEIASVFTDEGISGAKGRDKRPGFDALHKAIARKEIDMVVAWSVDRLGRSLQDLVAFLGEIHDKGVDLYLHQQGLDTSTSAGRALFGMLSVFAEFERALIQERVKAGMARAKANGTKTGEPLGRPVALTDKQVAKIKALRAQGVSIRKIADQIEVPVKRGKKARKKASVGTIVNALAA